jgi:hypothetical protein
VQGTSQPLSKAKEVSLTRLSMPTWRWFAMTTPNRSAMSCDMATTIRSGRVGLYAPMTEWAELWRHGESQPPQLGSGWPSPSDEAAWKIRSRFPIAASQLRLSDGPSLSQQERLAGIGTVRAPGTQNAHGFSAESVARVVRTAPPLPSPLRPCRLNRGPAHEPLRNCSTARPGLGSKRSTTAEFIARPSRHSSSAMRMGLRLLTGPAGGPHQRWQRRATWQAAGLSAGSGKVQFSPAAGACTPDRQGALEQTLHAFTSRKQTVRSVSTCRSMRQPALRTNIAKASG